MQKGTVLFFLKLGPSPFCNPSARPPLAIINSVAPVRIGDNGGWTDTWFAGHGRIFNIGVYPCAESQIAVFPEGGNDPDEEI